MKIQLNLPDNMKKDIDSRAAKMGLNSSAFIRLAIAEKLGLDKEYKATSRTAVRNNKPTGEAVLGSDGEYYLDI